MTLFNPCVHNLVNERKFAWVGPETQTYPTECGHSNHAWGHNGYIICDKSNFEISSAITLFCTISHFTTLNGV